MDDSACITCHGGVSGAKGMEAHEGVVREPDSVAKCAACHSEMVLADQSSLHTNLTGYLTVLTARSAPDKMPQLEEMMGNHCTTCHTSCGQCHVSRPTNLGGGLSAGHEFKQIPPMNLTCTGCHGSRIENEYKGKNEGVRADVHWIKGGMPCSDCHTKRYRRPWGRELVAPAAGQTVSTRKPSAARYRRGLCSSNSTTTASGAACHLAARRGSR